MNKETPATRLSTNEQEPTQQTACEPETVQVPTLQYAQQSAEPQGATPENGYYSAATENVITSTDLEYHESSPSENSSWNFYNQLQTIEPNVSHGGSNHTNSHLKQYRKRRNKQRTQRNSRRINRKH